MKLSISYKFKLKTWSVPARAGRCRWCRSGADQGQPGPVGAGAGAGAASASSAGADRCRS